jgi:hypothetical protein
LSNYATIQVKDAVARVALVSTRECTLFLQ